jgi:hypothetical protein
MDTVFRNVTTTQTKEPTVTAITPDVDGEAKVDPSFTDYQSETGKPYLADRFDLGDKLDVFADELSTIEDYLNDLISTGKIANTTKAVDKVLNDIEQLTNIKDEDRSVIRIEVIKAHIDFLNTTDQARKDFGKYN